MLGFLATMQTTLPLNFNYFSFFVAEGLKEYFSKYGDIAEVMVMKDPTTRRSRYLKFSLPKFCDVTWTYLLIILDFYDNPKLYFS